MHKLCLSTGLNMCRVETVFGVHLCPHSAQLGLTEHLLTDSDDRVKLRWSDHSSGTQKWSWAAIEDLASDTSLHH